MIPSPPIILLGIDNPIGLALIRELGAAGIEVHGIAREKRALGLHSRRLARGHMLEAEGEDAVVAQLRRIARRSGARFVMTVSMRDALLVRTAADAGKLPGLQPLLPSVEKLHLVNDKAAIAGIAGRLGIDTPLTWEPSVTDLAGGLPPLNFPCVLKWRDPEIALDRLRAAGLPLLKTIYAHGPTELTAVLDRYRPAGILPMVQAYVPGAGLGQMFVMRDGNAMLRFQHRRIHEWPPEGGVSTLCESVSVDVHPELMAKSEALLREIGWEGPAMVEYRYDASTGRAVLMEINGRFWGSLPLATAAGAPFGLATLYALGLRRPMPQPAPYRAGVRARLMVPETYRLLRILFAQRRIPDRTLRFSRLREVSAYLKGFADGTRYYVWSWRDPMPFFVDIAAVVGRAGQAVWNVVPRPRRASRHAAGDAKVSGGA
jgi:predicted ATP-grasp superfamily ATP-dependent carboligase